jgi:preprotein translocase subunit YajC
MNDTQDITTLTIRIAIFVVIAAIFYFVLKGDKAKK